MSLGRLARYSAKVSALGMWIFLASEVLFFGGLFITYAIYRSFNTEAFRIASVQTDIIYGAINTLFLLTSSLTMTVALRAAAAQLRRLTFVAWARPRRLASRFLVQGP